MQKIQIVKRKGNRNISFSDYFFHSTIFHESWILSSRLPFISQRKIKYPDLRETYQTNEEDFYKSFQDYATHITTVLVLPQKMQQYTFICRICNLNKNFGIALLSTLIAFFDVEKDTHQRNIKNAGRMLRYIKLFNPSPCK